MMNKCEQFMEQILNGGSSPELERHLNECRACRELADLSRTVLAERPAGIPVPEELDRKILAYAAGKRRTPIPFAEIFRKAVVPLAAGFVICFGLIFAYHENRVSAAKNRTVAAFSYDMMNNASELMMLSSRIEASSEDIICADAINTYDYTGDDTL